MSKKLLILGCGYSAQVLSKKLIAKRWQVFGTTRSRQNFEKIQDLGVEPIIWGDIPRLKTILEQECYILSSISPKGLIDDGINELTKLLRCKTAKVKWIGYLSSTGVYGDRQGRWVSETSKVDSLSPQGIARIGAEKSWLKLSHDFNIPLFIFRIGGIYGPKRNVFDRLRSGITQKIIKPNSYFNRIHVDDLCGAVCTSLSRPDLCGIYNVVDNLPTSGAKVIDEATKILGIPFLPDVAFSEAKLSDMAKSFYLESKRVSNKKLRHSLGYALRFPTYVDGLRSLANKGQWF